VQIKIKLRSLLHTNASNILNTPHYQEIFFGFCPKVKPGLWLKSSLMPGEVNYYQETRKKDNWARELKKEWTRVCVCPKGRVCLGKNIPWRKKQWLDSLMWHTRESQSIKIQQFDFLFPVFWISFSFSWTNLRRMLGDLNQNGSIAEVFTAKDFQ